MYNCVIIDDDQLSIDILKTLISQHPAMSTLATYTNPARAINEMLVGEEIDFLFLDIQMEISGIDVARKLRDKVRYLIFVTAYERYAIDAFKVHGDKFLLKPITPEKFSLAIDQILMKERR
ncbi:LytR/AlgR family response regulator transcription factor [Pedobacter endophyticus]|uniref:Response regulator n=1 Tax=Pedobacter endophyticus TaxID=2789740 RepID=A0A7S9PZR1_9SPHI|nr:response regulator [Pedobacter endophyticus]QPH40190.1 response regulator [Pedobacter endophyticus]